MPAASPFQNSTSMNSARSWSKRMADLRERRQAGPIQELPGLDVEATLGHRLHLVALQEGEPIPTSRVGVTQLAPSAGSPLASHARCVGDRATASWE